MVLFGLITKEHRFSFNKTAFKLSIKYLLANCYFTLGSMCFSKWIGIPMGFGTAPFYGKFIFTLLWKELASSNKKWDLRKAGTFSNNFNFTDEFENNYKDSYPDELELKKKNEETCKISILHLWIEVYDRKCTIELTDKRDSFPFYISCMSYLDRNMPSKIFHASIGSEILRIARATTTD